MSIEPVGSAMTYQVQSQTPKPVEKQNPDAADKDVAAQGMEKPDNTTIVIKDAEDADNKNDSKEKDDQQAAQSQKDKAQESIKKMLDKLEKNINANSEAVFGVHEDTKRITIKIVDRDTKEVLKEYPPEKTLDMIAKVWELAGLFVDEKR